MPRRRAVNEHVGLGGSVLHCKTLHCTYGDEERKHTDKRFFRVILSFVPLCVALSFTMSQIYLGRFALIEHRILFVPESLRNINQFPAFIDRLNDCGSLCMPGSLHASSRRLTNTEVGFPA